MNDSGWPEPVVAPGRELVIPPDLACVATARAFVRRHCHAFGLDAETCDTAALLTSETVTNAIIHGRSEARIRVTLRVGHLLVEVSDDNSRHPQRETQDTNALDGRGIAIVDILATAWGVNDDPYGKTVWFELRTTSAPRPTAR